MKESEVKYRIWNLIAGQWVEHENSPLKYRNRREAMEVHSRNRTGTVKIRLVKEPV